MQDYPPHQSATYRVSPAVRDLLVSNRERGHVHVMSAFRAGLGESPRSKLSLLWFVNLAECSIVVQSNEPPLWPGKIGEVTSTHAIPAPQAGEFVDIAVQRSCYKTPLIPLSPDLRAALERRGPDGKKLEKAYRARPVVVPECERQDWAAARLAALGLAPESTTLTVSEVKFASLGSRKRGIAYVDIHARALVADEGAFTRALKTGTGKGLNFGLGLIRATQVD